MKVNSQLATISATLEARENQQAEINQLRAELTEIKIVLAKANI